MENEKSTREERLRATVDAMIGANENISLRNIMGRMPSDFGYPNAITRQKELKTIYENGRNEQKRVRAAASSNHDSRASLKAKVTRQAAEIEELQGRVEVLVASHRAMYAAVGEFGGMKAWLRFFDKRESALEVLDSLRARREPTTLPTATAPSKQPPPALEGDEIPY